MPSLAQKLQDHLLHIWNDERPTLMLVTHDIEEALVMSDHIIVMRGNPGRVYREFTLFQLHLPFLDFPLFLCLTNGAISTRATATM